MKNFSIYSKFQPSIIISMICKGQVIIWKVSKIDKIMVFFVRKSRCIDKANNNLK